MELGEHDPIFFRLLHLGGAATHSPDRAARCEVEDMGSPVTNDDESRQDDARGLCSKLNQSRPQEEGGDELNFMSAQDDLRGLVNDSSCCRDRADTAEGASKLLALDRVGVQVTLPSSWVPVLGPDWSQALGGSRPPRLGVCPAGSRAPGCGGVEAMLSNFRRPRGEGIVGVLAPDARPGMIASDKSLEDTCCLRLPTSLRGQLSNK
mmetsp:Transcript_32397/g.70893  ORF Transcript_32397/g.70893 Transcript_32397/m.70893 type:complete len:207 (-) Transcript_32397:558-1178(-)